MKAKSRLLHTGQLFFDENVSDQVMQLAPCSRHSGRRTLQSQGSIFSGEHGSSSVVTLAPLKPGSVADGYLATIMLGVDPNVTPAAVGGGGPGGPPAAKPGAASR